MNEWLQRFFALILFLLFLPVIIVIGALLFIMSCGHILYREMRLGFEKKPFQIVKFCTMDSKRCIQLDEGNQKEWENFGKLHDDSRVALLGRFLRRFSLDELPQLWNVICGDMVLVGSRPIVEREDAIYGRHSDELHSVKPGMTGLWQVSGRNLTTYHRHVALNFFYVRHRCFSLDCWILLKTVDAVLRGRGAY